MAVAAKTDPGRRSGQGSGSKRSSAGWLVLPWRDRMFTLSAAFLVVMAVLGGSQRPEVPTQLVVRLIAIGVGAWALYGISERDVRRVRPVLVWLGALAVLMLLQLVPLPPGLWTALSGRDRFLPLLELSKVADVWRPLSLTPDMTINSLLATLPAFATLLLLCRLPSHMARSLLIPLLAVGAVAAVVGLLQAASSGQYFYFYRITNLDSAVGFFANRNHQGFLLAAMLPALAVLARGARRPGKRGPSQWIFLGIAIVLVPLVIITGSRGALALLVVGAMAAWLLFSVGRPRVETFNPRTRNLGLLALAAMGGVVVLAVTISARDFAVQRLFSEDVSQELRVVLFRPLLDIAFTYFPWGSGFGSFVDVFRVDEPLWNLNGSYLNHAHNELIELAIEGGIPALAILLGFMAWYVSVSVVAWRGNASDDRVIFARLGSTIIGMLMLASLADYPLRTPFMMVVFALSSVWLAAVTQPAAGQLYRSNVSD